MPEHAQPRSLGLNVEVALAAFCRDDPGRSAAVSCAAAGPGLIGLGHDIPRPAASVMKVPLVMALYDKAAAGELLLGEAVAVRDLGSTRYASILAAFDPGRSLSLGEVAALALIVSDNPATEHVLTRVGYGDVAAVLQRCGCSPAARMAAGFAEHELGRANRVNVLTAGDAVRIFDAMLKEPRYAPIVRVLENNLRNNRIPALLPEDIVVAHKTGSLDGVVNNAGVVSFGGRAFTLAVLTDNQPDPIATSRDIAELALTLSGLLLGHPA